MPIKIADFLNVAICQIQHLCDRYRREIEEETDYRANKWRN